MSDINLPDKVFFRIDEVARLFGVSRSTVYRWINEGILEHVKIGKSIIRIHKKALEDKINIQKN